MRILWLITRFWPAIGGGELHSRQIIHELAARGHTVCVVCHWDENRTDWLRGTTVRAPATVREYQDDEAARVVRLGYSRTRRLRALWPAATFYLRQAGATRTLSGMIEADLERLCGTDWDVVHGVRIGREPLYVAGYNFARRLGIPFVFTPLHHPRWVGWRYRTYLQLYRQADALIALTEHERKLYKALGVSERVYVSGIGPVLPLTADGNRFRERYQIRGPFVLFLGQKYAYKGFTHLLEAAKAVWREYPETVFGFVGPRTTASRRTFASVSDARVFELDAVDLQTKGDALAACDIFCLPSEQESFGGVYTEAWSYGKPVIGCDIPAVREVISHGVDGFLASPGSATDLSGLIVRLLAEPTLAAQMGARGREKVEQSFSWPQIAQRIEAAYHAAQKQEG